MSILLSLLAAASSPQGDFGTRKRADYSATLTASFTESDTNHDGVLDLAEMAGATKR